MKFCWKHWEQLKQGLRDRGLGELILSEEQPKATDLAIGAPTPAYCALRAVHDIICARSMQTGGMYQVTGDYCPVCEAIMHFGGKNDVTGRFKSTQDVERIWVDGPCGGVAMVVKKEGLLPPAIEGLKP